MLIFQTVLNSPTIKPNLSFVASKFIVTAVTEPELYQMLRLCLSWLELCNVVIGVAKHFVGPLHQCYKVIIRQWEQTNKTKIWPTVILPSDSQTFQQFLCV